MIRTLLTIAASKKWFLYQLDIENDFLHREKISIFYFFGDSYANKTQPCVA